MFNSDILNSLYVLKSSAMSAMCFSCILDPQRAYAFLGTLLWMDQLAAGPGVACDRAHLRDVTMIGQQLGTSVSHGLWPKKTKLKYLPLCISICIVILFCNWYVYQKRIEGSRTGKLKFRQSGLWVRRNKRSQGLQICNSCLYACLHVSEACLTSTELQCLQYSTLAWTYNGMSLLF